MKEPNVWHGWKAMHAHVGNTADSLIVQTAATIAAR